MDEDHTTPRHWTAEDLRWDRSVTAIGCTVSAILWGVICGLLIWFTTNIGPVLSRLFR